MLGVGPPWQAFTCHWLRLPVLQAVAAAARRPLVVVLFHGGPLDVSDMEASPRVGAILSAGMPGQHGALAVADILLGRVSPSGEPAQQGGIELRLRGAGVGAREPGCQGACCPPGTRLPWRARRP